MNKISIQEVINKCDFDLLKSIKEQKGIHALQTARFLVFPTHDAVSHCSDSIY